MQLDKVEGSMSHYRRLSKHAMTFLVSAGSCLHSELATADHRGLYVPPELAAISLDGHSFDISTVDEKTAETAFRSLGTGGEGLSNCRVIKVVERREALTFFLGMCEGGFAGGEGPTNFCTDGLGDYWLGYSYPERVSVRDLVEDQEDCLLRVCAGDACD